MLFSVDDFDISHVTALCLFKCYVENLEMSKVAYKFAASSNAHILWGESRKLSMHYTMSIHQTKPIAHLCHEFPWTALIDQISGL